MARRTEFRFISLDTSDHVAVVLPIHNLQGVNMIDYDPVERFVYWIDQDLHHIKRAKLDGSGIHLLFALVYRFILHRNGLIRENDNDILKLTF